jgi:hypothetical protein
MVPYRRLLSAVLLGASSLLAIQLAFAAASPLTGIASLIRVQRGSPPEEVSFSLDLPANFFKPGSCDFPIRVEATGKGGTIVLPGDRFIFTAPGLEAVVTNLDHPSQLATLRITGASHQSIEPNGDVVTVVTGRNLLGDPEAGFVLAIGTFTFIFDSAGNLIQPLTGTGQFINVCELID